MTRNTRIFPSLLLILFTLCWFTCAGCAGPTPKPESAKEQAKPKKQEPTEEDLFLRGYQHFQNYDYPKAHGALSLYLQKAPFGENADFAMLLLGKIELYHRDYKQAEKYFVELTRLYPNSEHVADAMHLVKVVSTEKQKAKETDEVHQLEAQLETAANPEEKEETTEKLVDALSERGELHKAFANALALWQESSPDKREENAQALIDVVDSMSRPELLQARSEVTDEPYPLGVVDYRLGALAMHLREFDRARGYFKNVIQEGDAHPLAKRAKDNLKKLDARFKTEPLKIGVLLPLSGRFKPIGERVRQAMELAISEETAEGGASIEFVFRDTQGSVLGANEALDKLIYVDNAIAAIGTILGDASEAAAHRAEEYEFPLITLSPRKGLPKLGRWVFRSAMTPQMQAKAIVEYAWKILGLKTYAILQPMHNYGEDMAFAFWDAVRDHGGWITGIERYEHDATMFKAPIRRLSGRYFTFYPDIRGKCPHPHGRKCGRVKQGYDEEGWPKVDFEAVFIPDYAKQAGMIAPAFPFEEVELDTHQTSTYRRIRRKEIRRGKDVKLVQLLGANGFNDPKLAQYGDKWVEGAIFCDGFTTLENEDHPEAKLFIDAFKKEFNRTPSSIEAYAYDAVKLASQTLKVGNPTGRAGFRQTLQGLTYKGATGEMQFDETGEMINPLDIFMIKEGEIIKAPMNKEFLENPELYTGDELKQEVN